MKPPVETVRVSQRSKEILTRLKAKTGIEHWNILCRWALCISLKSSNYKNGGEIVQDSNIEMSWKTFAGPFSDSLAAIFYLRLQADGCDVNDRETVAHSFRIYLERGILNLQAVKSIEGYFNCIQENTH